MKRSYPAQVPSGTGLSGRGDTDHRHEKHPKSERSTSVIPIWLGIKNDYRTLIKAEKLNLLELCENEGAGDDEE